MHSQSQPESQLATADDAMAALEAFMLKRIPLAQAMQLTIHAWHDNHLELRAPLAANINDKGCAFGGSLSSLMTLASWALLELSLRDAGLEADVFVANAEIRYLSPIFDELHVFAQPDDGASLNSFLDVLQKRGRARISMVSRVDAEGRPACVQNARFVAKLRT